MRPLLYAKPLALAFALIALAVIAVPEGAGAVPTPTSCQEDVMGANDEPGQRDLTQFCVELGSGGFCTGDLSVACTVDSPDCDVAGGVCAFYELHTKWNFDEENLPGGNTDDACSLYDTDADGLANLAACVTTRDGGAPMTLGAVRLFTCNDTRADRCAGDTQLAGNTCVGGVDDGDACSSESDCADPGVCMPAGNTTCMVSQTADDPFVGGDDFPTDTEALCWVDLDDFGEAGATLIDACSYPSESVNASPADCILFTECTDNTDCDDSNSCTADTCELIPGTNDKACRFSPVAQGTACDADSMFCTADVCNNVGFCEAGAPNSTDCDDGVSCTVDACNEATDSCDNTPMDTLCANGDFCDGDETCDAANDCQPGTPVNCSDGVNCTVDACNEATDSCDNTPMDTLCANGDFCDGDETCDAANDCQPGTPVNCSDGVNCTVDACNEATDSCDNTPMDTLCANGDFCDGDETCDAANDCQPGTPVNCSDGVNCTVDACNEATDSCDNTPMDTLCANGDFCDGDETCDAANDCQPGTPVNCSDGVNCTVDACNEATDSCDNTPMDTLCANGDFCDGDETCDAANDCQPGTPVNCSDGVNCTVDACNEATDSCDSTPMDTLCANGDFCDGDETCDAANDCQPGTPVNCSDGVNCTVDACNEATDSCDNTPMDTLCANGDFCDGDETCDAANDCQPGTPVNCSDGVNCTVDACNEATDSCDSTPMDTLCANGDFCDGDETCDAANDCQPGTPVNCSDGVNCTVDACNEATDSCDSTPMDTLCANGDFCDGDETCDAVNDCQPGTPVNCSDGVNCTVDACNEATDSCDNTPMDTLCANGDFCDGDETCDAVNDCQPGTPVNCSDGVNCTVDACNEATDSCDNTPMDTLCANGDFCDGDETCDAANDCQPGTPVNCSDGVNCTVDACNEATDSCENVPMDTLCDNGLFCDGTETCDLTLDCLGGPPPPVDDGVACTQDSCDEANDVIVNDPALCVRGSCGNS